MTRRQEVSDLCPSVVWLRDEAASALLSSTTEYTPTRLACHALTKSVSALPLDEGCRPQGFLHARIVSVRLDPCQTMIAVLDSHRFDSSQFYPHGPVGPKPMAPSAGSYSE